MTMPEDFLPESTKFLSTEQCCVLIRYVFNLTVEGHFWIECPAHNTGAKKARHLKALNVAVESRLSPRHQITQIIQSMRSRCEL